QLLRALAWWGPAGIPRELLGGPAPAVNQALGRLAAYSMITLTDRAIGVHPLVQALSRIPDPTDPHRHPADIDQGRESAAVCLLRALPRDPLDVAGWPLFRVLLPHIDALRRNADPASDTATTGGLCNQAGMFAQDQGDLVNAVAYFERAMR